MITSRAAVLGLAILSGVSLEAQAGLRTLPGLTDVTFYEKSGSVNPHAFGPNSSEMLNRLTTLDASSVDFLGVTTEYYDVFFSDTDGTPNIDGIAVTIECLFEHPTGGGGLNITEVELNFGSGPVLANAVTAFTQLGSNAIAGSELFAIDGDYNTHTTMGSTIGDSPRLSLTVTFPVPAPGGTLLGVMPLMALARRRRG